MENMPFLSQMKMGVLDNTGVSFTTKKAFTASKAKQAGNKNYSNFVMLKDKIIKHDRHQAHLDFAVVAETMKQILEVLEKSDKATSKIFLYANCNQLIEMQKVMIELGNHLIDFGDWVNF